MRGGFGSPNQIYPPPQSIKKFGVDFENDPGKNLLWSHLNITSPTNYLQFDILRLGETSIEKIPKISASGRNFLDPLPPSLKKGPTDENVSISYLIVIIKFGFFRVSNPSPPLFHQKAEPHRFYQLRWPLTLTLLLLTNLRGHLN